MPERRGSWDSFPQFIRWSRPPSFYACQAPAPAVPPVPEPPGRRASEHRAADRTSRRSQAQTDLPAQTDLAGLLKRMWERGLSGLRAFR